MSHDKTSHDMTMKQQDLGRVKKKKLRQKNLKDSFDND